MKNRITKFALLLVTLSSLFLATGCLVHTQPADAVVVSAAAPPAQVYYGGRTLHYRADGYYYYDSGAWIVAPTVPTYLVSYHRPQYVGTTYYSRPVATTRPVYNQRPVHASRPGYTTSRPGYTTSRPGYTTSRPGYTTSRPGYTTSRPGQTSVRPSGPTHVTRPGGSGVVNTPNGARPTQGRTIQSR